MIGFHDPNIVEEIYVEDDEILSEEIEEEIQIDSNYK
jgi:hypothetical protein